MPNDKMSSNERNQIAEFLTDYVGLDSLKSILRTFELSENGTKGWLVRRIRDTGLTPTEVLGCLSRDELTEICGYFDLPRSGSKKELASSINKFYFKGMNRPLLTYGTKKGSMDVLVEDIMKWKPNNFRREQRYTNSLLDHLDSIGWYATTSCPGNSRADIVVNECVPIELKLDLSTKPQQNGTLGQLCFYHQDFHQYLLIICNPEDVEMNLEFTKRIPRFLRTKSVVLIRNGRSWKKIRL